MESEEHKSFFSPYADDLFLRVVDLFDSERADPTRKSFNDGGRIFKNRIFSVLYDTLDGWSGAKTFVFNDPRKSRVHFERVIEELSKRGFVGSAGFLPFRYNDAPAFYCFAIFGAYPNGVTDGKRTESSYGASFGKNKDEVISKTLGEFLERYFLTLYKKNNLRSASISQLDDSGMAFLHPKECAGFSSEQKQKNHKFTWDSQSMFRWSEVVRISNGVKTLVPAQLIYWNYLRGEDERMLRECNSNGCGGMFTKESAILAGLYEIIQRDSFLWYWLNAVTPPRIDPKTVPDPIFQQILEESHRYKFDIRCMDITLSIGAPSFIVGILDKSGGEPYFSIGGGCQADPAKALRRALEEAWGVYYRTRSRIDLKLNDSAPLDCLGQNERIRLWAKNEMKEHAEFFISGKVRNFSDVKFSYPPKFSSSKEELEYLVRRVESFGPGYEVYAHVVNNPILKKVGYSVARVMVPKLIPFYLKEQNIPLGADRLKSTLAGVNIRNGNKVNPWPHPFP